MKSEELGKGTRLRQRKQLVKSAPVSSIVCRKELTRSLKKKTENKSKVCFIVSNNGFSQIFCNCLNVDEIFSWHN